MKSQIPTCSIIIVTNNSEKYIHKALQCIHKQTLRTSKVIIVDSGSTDTSYLNLYRNHPLVEIIIAEPGIGFCKGNNIGIKKLPGNCDFVFFLNPDAFLDPKFLQWAIAFMNSPLNQDCGAITGISLGYDINKDKPTDTYDSTGVFRTWYGRWYDRGQGQKFNEGLFLVSEEIPAICGAVFFCRKKALDSVMIRDQEVFDNTFYMYKEDIDLSLRLRRKGWKLAFVPQLVAYHCRGWQKERSKMARVMRMASARNELKLQWRQKFPLPIFYSLLKYAAVKFFNM